MKIGIIGKRECILGFRALGLETFPVKNGEEARAQLLKISEDDFAIIFITESLAQEVYDTIGEINQKTFPAVKIIPDLSGAQGFAFKLIREAMLRAVGTDVTKDS